VKLILIINVVMLSLCPERNEGAAKHLECLDSSPSVQNDK